MNPPYVNVIQSSDYIVQEGDTVTVDGTRYVAAEVTAFPDVPLIAYRSPSGVVLVPERVNVRVEEVEG